jgi:serine protease Do
MKPLPRPTALLRFVAICCASLVSCVGIAPALHAARDRDQKKPENRPPLKLAIDQKSIDRRAPAPVSYAPIVDRTANSVVYVYSTKEVKRPDLPPFLNDPAFRRFFGVPGPGQNRLPDRVQQGLGSGVVVSEDGYILTNNHVVEGADEVKVSIGLSDKRFEAKVVGTDTLADIAVLKIEPDKPLAPATLGDSDQLQVGDVVFAIGNPFGVGQSVSRGIVSALSRGNLGIEAIEDFIQTDAAINPGNSGGALIDTAGRVVGINTAILSRTGGFAGVGFAVPINLVRLAAEQIVSTGRVTRGFLGVAPQRLSPELATQFGSDHGALIAEITPGSAAEKAGLQVGDVITKLNGNEIRDPRQLLLAVSQLAPDTKVTIQYLRDSKTQEATATLGRRPNQEIARGGGRGEDGSDVGVLNGVSVGDITPDVRDQLQIPARITGALVTSIDPDSAAAQQGLREGDIILSLDRKPVRNADEAVRLSEEIKGPKVMVLVWREGRSQFIVIDESEE